MKEIKGLKPVGKDEEASKAAMAFVDGVAKVVSYLVSTFLLLATCAMVAFVVMTSLSFMHDQEPAVPPFGFMFVWAAVWGSAVLGLFAGSLVKIALKEDE